MIDQPYLFMAGALLLKARDELKYGEYQFAKNASLRDVVNTIIEGKVVQHAFTIAEGLTSDQVVQRLLENDVLTGNIREVPREGTLLPETYRFTRGMTREQMIQRMQQQQRRLVQEIWDRRMADLPIRSAEQLVVLASIVEKETGKPEERTRVAAVFVNRLKQKMKLQSDPTIIYGLVGGKGTLGRRHPAQRDRPADALQHLRHRRPAARPDRQSGPRLARGRRQSGAHQGAVLRRRRHRRPCLRRQLRAAPEERRAAARARAAGEPAARRGDRPRAVAVGASHRAAIAVRFHTADSSLFFRLGMIFPKPVSTCPDHALRSREFSRTDSDTMALSSMTGFARSHGVAGAYAWAWELKSVNAKGLDLKLRLPLRLGCDRRCRCATAPPKSLSRGSVFANLTVSREGVAPVARINEPVLAAVLATLKDLSGKANASPPTLDGILSLKGVMEVTEAEEKEDERRAAEAAIVAGFAEALKGLEQMRHTEGAALGHVLAERLAEIAALAARAEAAPGRKAEAIKARLAEQIAALLEASQRFDPDRLHQEAILMASQGRHPRGARPPRRPCRAGAQAARRRRPGRAPARFSVAGAQPRIEYAVRQGERRRTDQHRPGAQGGGRAVPRAGAEPGVTMARAAKTSKAVARRGMMLVLSSPSGAGKTTLSRRLLAEERRHRTVDLGHHAAEAARRGRRPALSFHRRANDLTQLARAGELLEHAEVFGNRYGTPRKPVEQALKQGRDVLFDIDWQGTQQLREKMPRRSGQRVRAAAVDSRTGAAPAHPGAGRQACHPRAHGQGRAAK